VGNLSSKVGDYTPFLNHWIQPSGGIEGYLNRFLASGDPTFQHIAIWTLLQLLESEDENLIKRIQESKDIVEMVQGISERGVDSVSDGEEYDGDEDGEGEVVGLARRCLEVLGVGGGGGRSLVEG